MEVSKGGSDSLSAIRSHATDPDCFRAICGAPERGLSRSRPNSRSPSQPRRSRVACGSCTQPPPPPPKGKQSLDDEMLILQVANPIRAGLVIPPPTFPLAADEMEPLRERAAADSALVEEVRILRRLQEENAAIIYSQQATINDQLAALTGAPPSPFVTYGGGSSPIIVADHGISTPLLAPTPSISVPAAMFPENAISRASPFPESGSGYGDRLPWGKYTLPGNFNPDTPSILTRQNREPKPINRATTEGALDNHAQKTIISHSAALHSARSQPAVEATSLIPASESRGRDVAGVVSTSTILEQSSPSRKPLETRKTSKPIRSEVSNSEQTMAGVDVPKATDTEGEDQGQTAPANSGRQRVDSRPSSPSAMSPPESTPVLSAPASAAEWTAPSPPSRSINGDELTPPLERAGSIQTSHTTAADLRILEGLPGHFNREESVHPPVDQEMLLNSSPTTAALLPPPPEGQEYVLVSGPTGQQIVIVDSASHQALLQQQMAKQQGQEDLNSQAMVMLQQHSVVTQGEPDRYSEMTPDLLAQAQPHIIESQMNGQEFQQQNVQAPAGAEDPQIVLQQLIQNGMVLPGGMMAPQSAQALMQAQQTLQALQAAQTVEANAAARQSEAYAAQQAVQQAAQQAVQQAAQQGAVSVQEASDQHFANQIHQIMEKQRIYDAQAAFEQQQSQEDAVKQAQMQMLQHNEDQRQQAAVITGYQKQLDDLQKKIAELQEMQQQMNAATRSPSVPTDMVQRTFEQKPNEIPAQPTQLNSARQGNWVASSGPNQAITDAQVIADRELARHTMLAQQALAAYSQTIPGFSKDPNRISFGIQEGFTQAGAPSVYQQGQVVETDKTTQVLGTSERMLNEEDRVAQVKGAILEALAKRDSQVVRSATEVHKNERMAAGGPMEANAVLYQVERAQTKPEYVIPESFNVNGVQQQLISGIAVPKALLSGGMQTGSGPMSAPIAQTQTTQIQTTITVPTKGPETELERRIAEQSMLIERAESELAAMRNHQMSLTARSAASATVQNVERRRSETTQPPLREEIMRAVQVAAREAESGSFIPVPIVEGMQQVSTSSRVVASMEGERQVVDQYVVSQQKHEVSGAEISLVEQFGAERVGRDENGEYLIKRVEVPVYEERLTQIPKKEVVEKVVRKTVPEIVYSEKIVEVPETKIVDKIVEVEKITEKIVHVPVKQIVDRPVEVIKKVGVESIVVKEQVVEVPGEVVEIPKSFVVERPVIVPRYVDRYEPVVVAQSFYPRIKESDEMDECRLDVDCLITNFVTTPMDVFIPMPVNRFLVFDELQVQHSVIDSSKVPHEQFNSLVKNLNPQLSLDHAIDLFRFISPQHVSALHQEWFDLGGLGCLPISTGPGTNLVQLQDNVQIKSKLLHKPNEPSSTSQPSGFHIQDHSRISAFSEHRELGGSKDVLHTSPAAPPSAPPVIINSNANNRFTVADLAAAIDARLQQPSESADSRSIQNVLDRPLPSTAIGTSAAAVTSSMIRMGPNFSNDIKAKADTIGAELNKRAQADLASSLKTTAQIGAISSWGIESVVANRSGGAVTAALPTPIPSHTSVVLGNTQQMKNQQPAWVAGTRSVGSSQSGTPSLSHSLYKPREDMMAAKMAEARVLSTTMAFHQKARSDSLESGSVLSQLDQSLHSYRRSTGNGFVLSTSGPSTVGAEKPKVRSDKKKRTAEDDIPVWAVARRNNRR